MHNWDNYRILLALARTGSPEAAGRVLRMDESTVRRRLNALQRETGAKLVERSASTWRCTYAGNLLVEQAMAMEQGLREAETQLQAADPNLVGTVRVGAPEGYGSYVIAPAAARLQEMVRGLSIELLCYNSPADIARREVDILIVTEPPVTGSFRIRKLKPVPLGLYASGDYIRRNGAPHDREDIGRHSLIGYDPAAEYARSALRSLQELDIAPRAGLMCSSVIAQLRATIAGAGLCFLPIYMIEPAHDLVPLLADKLPLEIDLWLLVHADISALDRVRAVVDAIAEASNGF